MRSRHFRNPAGFGLIEMLVTIGILAVISAAIGSMTVSAIRSYRLERELLEAQNNARTTVDTLIRLLRMAGNDPKRIRFQALDPDPDGNGQWDSIRVRADWNPPDGALDDPFEDVAFSTAGGTLFIQEAADPTPVEFLEKIDLLTFTYFDRDKNPIADPAGIPGSITHIEVGVRIKTTETPKGMPPMVYSAAVTLRKREKP